MVVGLYGDSFNDILDIVGDLILQIFEFKQDGLPLRNQSCGGVVVEVFQLVF